MKTLLLSLCFTFCFSLLLVAQDSVQVHNPTLKQEEQQKPEIKQAPVQVQKQDSLATPLEEDNSLYVLAEEMPDFPGGVDSMKVFIDANMNYAGIVLTKNTEERVLVEFVVEKDGTISDVAILRSSGNKVFDNEALRVIKKMPLWKPGLMEQKLVRTKLIIPVRFKK